VSVRFAWRAGESHGVVEAAADGPGRVVVTVEGEPRTFEVEPLGPGCFRLRSPQGVTRVEITASGTRRFVRVGTLDFVLEREAGGRRSSRGAHAGGLEAPMPGVVIRVLVAPGERVRKGQPLVALEAMKMEHVIRAPRDGAIRTVPVQAGELVNGGATLVEMDAEAGAAHDGQG